LVKLCNLFEDIYLSINLVLWPLKFASISLLLELRFWMLEPDAALTRPVATTMTVWESSLVLERSVWIALPLRLDVWLKEAGELT
jgi:hypothetical protein